MATITKGKTFVNGELVTPEKIHQLVDSATVTNITNADLAAGAAIADTKLAQITTAGKVANSATTATNASTANAIVARDGSGNFSAGTITANLTGNVTGNASTATTATTAAACSGNAATATTLQTARTINGVSFNGSANITVTATPDAHTHDDRYYTETEMNTLLAGKQASGSYAPATGIAPSAITGTAVITTDSRLSDARTPTTHTHDDRYYTEAEVNSLLAAKQNSLGFTPVQQGGGANQGTNKLFMGWSSDSQLRLQIDSTDFGPNWPINVTGTASGNAPASHTHDDRYYTETEMNTLLAGKQDSGSYAPASGIAPSAITGTAVITTDSRLSDARTPTTHTHDDRYYTETEMNTLLAGKAGATHNQGAETITSGTLANARTTATSNNTVNAIVARDVFGDFSARIINVNGLTQKLFDNSTTVFSAQVVGSMSGQGCRVDVSHTDGMGDFVPFVSFNYANSSIGSIKRVSASSVAYTTTSDYRLKTNIEPLTAAVARLLQIPVHRFNWLADPSGQKVDGFLAHEAQAVVPESVTGTKDAVDADGKPIYQGIDQSKLVPLLVAAVQELAARVAALEAK
jgi:hypothetical protein